jgi:hypothetical protein
MKSPKRVLPVIGEIFSLPSHLLEQAILKNFSPAIIMGKKWPAIHYRHG